MHAKYIYCNHILASPAIVAGTIQRHNSMRYLILLLLIIPYIAAPKFYYRGWLSQSFIYMHIDMHGVCRRGANNSDLFTLAVKVITCYWIINILSRSNKLVYCLSFTVSWSNRAKEVNQLCNCLQTDYSGNHNNVCVRVYLCACACVCVSV